MNRKTGRRRVVKIKSADRERAALTASVLRVLKTSWLSLSDLAERTGAGLAELESVLAPLTLSGVVVSETGELFKGYPLTMYTLSTNN